MKFIKILAVSMTLIFASAGFAKESDGKKIMKRKLAVAADGSKMFNCSNAPAKIWGEYPCVSGFYKDSETITEVSYGICSGSTAAEEEEPVDVTEFASLKNNPKLAATSKEWKTASAFDVTTESLGPATLYIKKESFAGKEKEPKIRIKKGKESIIVRCGGFK